MDEREHTGLVVGIFVGGRGRRMGGVAKGNLTSPDGEQLAARLLRECAGVVPRSAVVLVGAAAAYGDLGVPALADEPTGIGPLGGLRALLLHTEAVGASCALALACDLPFLGGGLIERLAHEAPGAAFLGPRSGEVWSTLAARYALSALPAVDAAIAASEHALQSVVRRLGAGAIELSVSEVERAELRDWDTPADRLG
jgi:molybdopterin-guanine dinucleotide biosynthesis protein A